MNICYFAADFSGPGFYRCLFPGQEMHRFGHRAFAPETRLADHQRGAFVYDIKVMPDADLYVLQQRPERVWLTIIPQLRAKGKIVVCDTDDYYAGIPVNHPAYEPTRNLVKPLHEIYALADCLTVSTPFLARAYLGLNANVKVIPNFLDWGMWESLPARSWNRVRIGWMGEGRMRPDDLRVLQGIIGPFLRRHPEVDFVAAGDPGVHGILEVPHSQRVSYPRVLFTELPSITATMDVGLVPLARTPFNEAKSYLKGLEYAACGIPCIASATESYREWVEPGVNGLLAKRPRDWIRHLETLVTDHELRERMGKAARAKAAKNTIQGNAHRWHEVFASLEGDWADRITRTAISKKALQKPAEFSGLLRHLRGLRLETIVEIGTAQGGTLWALCQIAAPTALIVSIDLPGGDLDEQSADDKYGERDLDKMAGYRKEEQRLEFLQMDSHDPATRAELERILGGRSIDLLFIDGDHSYQGVKDDFERYSPLVDGLVCFHDIRSHYPQSGVEVDRYWAEIRADYVTREFSVPGQDWGWGPWGGIGVVELETERAAA